MKIRFRQLPTQLREKIALNPDLGRAIRSTVALTIGLSICLSLGYPNEALFVAMAGQNLSLPDLRGAYRVRFTFLLTMILIAATSAGLGVLCGHSLWGSIATMAGIALLNSLWRQVSADYGSSISVSSGLFFLVALSHPGNEAEALKIAGLVGLGGSIALLLHFGLWLFRPQHPLRYATAENWVALSDLIAAFRTEISSESFEPSEVITKWEGQLRESLDRTFLILSQSDRHHRSALLGHLEEIRLEAVHLSMSISALHNALESALKHPDFGCNFPVLDSVLKALGDTARSVAVSLIIHRSENYAATNIRLRRSRDLMRVLEEQLGQVDRKEFHPLVAVLKQIRQMLPRISVTLAETVDQTGVRFSSPPSLPELGTKSIQSLAAWVNPRSRLDPILLRHGIRITLLTVLAVGVYKGFEIPRGYWIALTVIVVLQPDYGSTRQRAGERIGGTLVASLLASALLWIHLPSPILYLSTAGATFGFAYFLKRQYGIAVFFVTFMIVLLTEITAPVHLEFTLTRISSTLLGGCMALIAARAFWPIWERETFTTLLAAAVRANKLYLEAIGESFGMPTTQSTDLLMVKRRAENANRYVTASLDRLLHEPTIYQENPERDTALSTYNQRATRALTGITLHLQDGSVTSEQSSQELTQKIISSLEKLAQAIEANYEKSAITSLNLDLSQLEETLNKPLSFPPGSSPSTLVWSQLVKTTAELRAMTFALRQQK